MIGDLEHEESTASTDELAGILEDLKSGTMEFSQESLFNTFQKFTSRGLIALNRVHMALIAQLIVTVLVLVFAHGVWKMGAVGGGVCFACDKGCEGGGGCCWWCMCGRIGVAVVDGAVGVAVTHLVSID